MLCCKSLGSACACHRLLHSPRCLNENVFIVLSKSERAHAALCLSLCWEENSTHRSVVWMCNQALNKNHDKETSVISVHLHSCLIYYCIQWFRLTYHLLILCLKLCMCEKIQNICWLSIAERMNHILEHSHTGYSPSGIFNCAEVSLSRLRRLGLDCSCWIYESPLPDVFLLKLRLGQEK